MASSGSYSGGSTTPYLSVSWVVTQRSDTNNYSLVQQSITLHTGSESFGAGWSGTSSINGNTVSFSGSSAITPDSSITVYTQNEVRVNHDSDGKAENIPLSASFRTADGVTISVSASTNVTLDPTDNVSPTVSITIDSIRGVRFSFTAKASRMCNSWYYKLNSGESVPFSSQDSMEQSYTINNLNPGTRYTLTVTAYRTSNAHSGYATTTVTTTVQSYLASVNTLTIDSAAPNLVFVAEVANSSYTHTLRIRKPGISSAIISKTGLNLADGTNTIPLTSEEITSLLNSNTTSSGYSAYFDLLTYNGSTQVGSVSTVSAIVRTTSANSGPIFTGTFTYEDTNSATVAVTEDNQIIVQRQSIFRVFSPTATPRNQASISKYQVTIGTKTAESTNGSTTTIDFGTIDDVDIDDGKIDVTVKVIDSRGYSKTITQKISIIKYDNVDITNCVIDRRNSAEEPLTINLSGTISPVRIDDVNKNSIMYAAFRYKRTDETNWGSWVIVTEYVSSSETSFSYITDRLISLDVNNSYNVEVKVEDAFSEDVASDDVGPGIPLVSFRKHKVGINLNEPTSALDVVGEIRQNGNGILGYIGTISNDFNNYTETGFYIYNHDSSVTVGHKPQNVSGVLLVIKYNDTEAVQMWISSANSLYTRAFTNNSWSSWSTK